VSSRLRNSNNFFNYSSQLLYMYLSLSLLPLPPLLPLLPFPFFLFLPPMPPTSFKLFFLPASHPPLSSSFLPHLPSYSSHLIYTLFPPHLSSSPFLFLSFSSSLLFLPPHLHSSFSHPHPTPHPKLPEIFSFFSVTKTYLSFSYPSVYIFLLLLPSSCYSHFLQLPILLLSFQLHPFSFS
jgi:hypothetical protein